ncbi:recombinase [Allopusillimonas soli]|uniref:Recombinase n=1 Tax=Allopusillimonas soli TaxID=659016 RepID=A0A853FDE9_9BURK|nr:Ref family recombination enhancement nuclease [Allopusillimonas soli]NYT38894.1 recombinase [Allopusillimonas soli]TEA70107.1 recombinase [Allopusillimonas soli]
MKGRPTSAAEKRFHDQLARHIGCIACLLSKSSNPEVSIHHIDGRTKPWAHWLVLPLCAGHHQENTGRPGLIPVHPWTNRFEQAYGPQPFLLHVCLDILERRHGIIVPQARAAANGDWSKAA